MQLVRSRSTAQTIKTWEEDSGASAFLYGANIGHAAIARKPFAQNPHVSPKKPPVQAWTTPATHSAPQQDGNPSSPSDFLQDQIDFPTSKDYPDLDPSIFMLPKGPIMNALRDKANFDVKFTRPMLRRNEPDSFQCTVTCVSRGSPESDIGIGHGPTKVCFAGRLTNSLTMPRNSLRGLPINICYISFIRLEPSGTSSR